MRLVLLYISLLSTNSTKKNEIFLTSFPISDAQVHSLPTKAVKKSHKNKVSFFKKVHKNIL